MNGTKDKYSGQQTFVQPGGFYFGGPEGEVRTLLGSCVAITLWHPTLHKGGMCHYLLPENNKSSTKDALSFDGRYASGAFALFMKEVNTLGVSPSSFEAKIFGGARMFGSQDKAQAMHDVGNRNIDVGCQLLNHYGFRLKVKHVGGNGRRNLILDLSNGDVWVRYVPAPRVSGDAPVVIERGV
ncbi:MAG: chemotaxis protein CheD [Hahellaceae bacterium]|nr:chemotaxis protein CheD [Hahellaceae bacterium]MCP5168384.1 chemotaxis protein CheD [Hahellaceae bacterium]